MNKLQIIDAACNAMMNPRGKQHWPDSIASTIRSSGKGCLEVNRIIGGLTNILSTVSLTNEYQSKLQSSALSNTSTKPVNASKHQAISTSFNPVIKSDDLNKINTNKVLVRQYGKGTEVLINRINEESIAVELSSSGIAPIVFGTFSGGRVEEYFEGSRSLKCIELQDVSNLSKIGALLARFHCQDIKSVEKKDALRERFYKWFDESKLILSKNDEKVKNKGKALTQHERAMFYFDSDCIKIEIDWLLNKAIPDLLGNNSKLVFCHYDVQEGNILKRPDRNNNLFLIDFEYSGYGHRGFDFGNLFCEMTLDYNISHFPGFVCNPDSYPNDDQQNDFFQSYVESWNKANSEHKITDISILKKEAALFEMASHLVWTLWSIIQSNNSSITFGFLEYGQARWGQYLSRKAKYIGNEQAPSNINGTIHP